MDELIFQLKAPIEGTGDGIVMKGVVSSILPAVILTGLFFVFFFLAEKRTESGEAGAFPACRIFSSPFFATKQARSQQW